MHKSKDYLIYICEEFDEGLESLLSLDSGQILDLVYSDLYKFSHERMTLVISRRTEKRDAERFMLEQDVGDMH